MTRSQAHTRMIADRCRPCARRHAAALAAVALLTACGSGDTTAPTATPPATPPAANATVNATPSFAFTPPSLTITAGDTVTFAFGSLQHNVFFDPQATAPADISGSNVNVSVPRVFPTAGTYRYTCHIHPLMVGTIVVQPRGG